MDPPATGSGWQRRIVLVLVRREEWACDGKAREHVYSCSKVANLPVVGVPIAQIVLNRSWPNQLNRLGPASLEPMQNSGKVPRHRKAGWTNINLKGMNIHLPLILIWNPGTWRVWSMATALDLWSLHSLHLDTISNVDRAHAAGWAQELMLQPVMGNSHKGNQVCSFIMFYLFTPCLVPRGVGSNSPSNVQNLPNLGPTWAPGPDGKPQRLSSRADPAGSWWTSADGKWQMVGTWHEQYLCYARS
jgi:hypothetical protein